MNVFKQVCKCVVISVFVGSLACHVASAEKGYGHHGKGSGKSHSKQFSNKSNKGGSKARSAKAKSAKDVTNKKFQSFTKKDKSVIEDYATKNPISGAALPPGIAMNLARGKPLPPGIAKVFLPDQLVSTLPAYPGYEYLAVDNNVLLVNQANNMIADIISLKAQ